MSCSLRRARTVEALVAAIAVAAVAACGGRIDPLADCKEPADAYCQANGCPLTGPTASSPASLQAWCQAWPALASKVTGIGACTKTDGTTWATDVRLSWESGGSLYLLYDPTTGALVNVSTLASAQGGDAGQTDYGTCEARSGIVTCATVGALCGP
jgi:hypothetical protein